MPFTKCYNPFQYEYHKNKNVRKVNSGKIVGKNVPHSLYLCDKCRKQLVKEGWPKVTGKCKSKPKSSASSTDLKNLEEFKIENEFESENKAESDCENESDSDFSFAKDDKSTNNGNDSADLLQIIEKLKNKFNDPQISRFEKYELLKLVPDSWGERKVAKIFGCSRQLVKQAREGKSDKINGNSLSEEIKTLVISFYEKDTNSRLLPGKKDFVPVKQSDGKRVHVQKRLILCNLSELYYLFKLEHPNCKIGFSTFARLRPKHCVLAGSCGTHSVCVCTYHENVHLMIDGASIPSLTESSVLKLTSYKDCLKIMVCENATPQCHSGECKKCENNIDIIKDHLNEIFESNGINKIEFQIWESTDRSTLISQVQDSNEFVETFCEKLTVLRNHDFIARQQASYLDNLKKKSKRRNIKLKKYKKSLKIIKKQKNK